MEKSPAKKQAINTFQQYAQMENQKGLQSETEKPITAKYRSLINRYPEILHTDFKTEEPKHGVFYNRAEGRNSVPEEMRSFSFVSVSVSS